MGNGFFQGGYNEGYQGSRKLTMAEEELATNKALRERGLRLEQSKAGADNSRALLAEFDKTVNDLWKTMEATAAAFQAAGKSPDEVARAVSPLAQHAVDILHVTGRDPAVFLDRAKALAGLPSAPGTADQKDYEYYARQETGAGRTPLSFDDYSTRSKKAGATSVVVGGEAAFTSELGKLTAKDFAERRTGALDAAKSIENSRVARDLLDKGVVTGAGADWLLSFGKMLQAAGVREADDAIANTEAFGASRARETANVIKAFGSGTGLSDADREYALQAAAGKITMSEQSIRKVLEISDRASRNVLKAYNADASKIDRNIVPFDLTIPEPSTPATPSAAPVTRTIGGKTYFQRDGKWFAQ